MKKLLLIFAILSVLTSCCAFAAKYKVNTSGVVKNSNGTVISSPSNAINQNYYNNYSAQSYVDSNAVNQVSASTIEIVMDFSGSMANWIGVAKRSMSSIIAQIPSSTQIGFRVFGHDNYGNNPSNTGGNVGEIKKMIQKGNKIKVVTEQGPLGTTSGVCAATQQVTPIMSANSNALLAGMNSVNIGGATPMVYALDRAVNQDFVNLDKVSPKKIVLITDGGENCGGDPCEFARRLMQKRSDVHIDVVLVSSHSKSLQCLSSTTGGHFYTIDNLSNFTTTMTQSLQSQPEAMPNQIKEQQNQNYEFIND